MSDNYSDYSHSDNEEDDEDFDEKSECEFHTILFPPFFYLIFVIVYMSWVIFGKR